MPSSDPILPYATAPVDALVVEHDAHHLRVTVPPARSWRTLPRGYSRSLSVLLLLEVWILTQALFSSPDDRNAILPSAFVYALVISLILLCAFLRLQTWFTFILTADDLFLHRRLGRITRSVTRWPRSYLLEVRHNQLENRLILRLKDQDALNLRVSPLPEVTAQVARHLQETMTSPLEPSPAPPAPLQAAMNSSPAPFYAIAAILILYLASSLLLFFRNPIAGFLLLYISPFVFAVPLGIWLGTQKKDLFL